jgi:DNA-binding transcriptional regulator LsrR (DeoR family)
MTSAVSVGSNGPHHRQLGPRIVALRLVGLTHQAIAYRLRCSETHVQRTLSLLKAEGLIA